MASLDLSRMSDDELMRLYRSAPAGSDQWPGSPVQPQPGTPAGPDPWAEFKPAPKASPDPWAEFRPANQGGGAPLQRFEIKGPDGSTYQVEAPDQASALSAFDSVAGPGSRRAGPDLSKMSDRELMGALNGGAPRGGAPRGWWEGDEVVKPAPGPNWWSGDEIVRPAPSRGGSTASQPSAPMQPGARMQPAAMDPDLGPIYAPGQAPIPREQPQLPVVQPQGRALGRGAAQGVTLGFADEIAGAGSAITGGGYQAGRDAYRRSDAEAEAAHPWMYGGGKLVGNVAGVAPAMLAAPGLFGLTGAALGARTVASGVSGGVMGGVQGFGEGEGGIASQGLSSLAGAVGGGVLGTVAPVLGQVAGSAVSPLVQRFVDRRAPVPGVSNEAARFLAEDFRNAGGRVAVDRQLAKLGPEARLLDASPSFEGSAQGLSVRPETREMIVDPLIARGQGTGARLASDLDAAMGPAPLPSQIAGNIEAGQVALSPDYNRAFQGARAVDTTPLAQRLDAATIDTRGSAQKAVRDVRGYLDVPGNPGTLDPSPRALLSTRQAIDGRLATEADPNAIRALTAARVEVDGELARAVPGIKPVDAQFAELARQGEALQRGSQLLDGGKSAVRPQDLAQELLRGAQPQGQMVGPSAAPFRMREGVRAEIDRLVGTTANDLTALKQAVKGEGDWNRAKLEQLFGRDEAARVFNAVDREAAFDGAYNRLAQNSMTEVRRQAAERFDPRGSSSSANLTMPLAALGGAISGGPAGSVGGMALAAALRGGRAISTEATRLADLARNKELARVLLMKPGEPLNEVLAGLERRAAGIGAGDKAAAKTRLMGELLLRSQGNEIAQRGRRLVVR